MTGKFITKKELTGFENLLSVVDTDRLDINPYAKRYLQHILAHQKYYCRIYVHLLNLALQHTVKRREEICLVDYGAGNGVMGLLAKYAGFGKVFINDLNGDFIVAANKLSQAMGIFPDGFIEGDIEQVKKRFENSSLDIIVGTDVIEHIYHLQHFFATVKEINPAVVTVMSTACNPANYFKTRGFKKLQVKDELYGGSPGDNVLFGETVLEPFIEIRRKMIASFAGSKLSASEVNELSIYTRGLRKEDIEKAVEKYSHAKILPVTLSHPTNTCHPVTGSWSERLLSVEEYTAIYTAAGFEVKFYDGFYNAYENNFKSILLTLLNAAIPFTAHHLSPFITIVGKGIT